MLDLLIVAAFVVYSVSVGLWQRRKASRGLGEYFLAGRSLRGWQAGSSMAATQFAADTPLVVVGLIATGGIFMVWRLWVYGIAFLLMAFVFAGLWRRSGVLTDAELAETRYSGRAVLPLRVVKAVYYGTVFNCVVIAMVLSATLTIAEVFLPWHAWLPGGAYEPVRALVVDVLGLRFTAPASELEPGIATANNVLSVGAVFVFVGLYSMTGGLRSVVATDLVQFALGIVGSVALAWVLLAEAGGVDGLVEGARKLYPENAAGEPAAGDLFGFLPPGGAALLPFVMLMGMQWLFQINADGTGYLAQRSMACRDEGAARSAGLWFAWLQIFLRSLPWVVIGAALVVVYPFDPSSAGAAGFAGERERTFVTAIRDFMPAGLTGVMMVALLAALASTLDTHMNWGASYWSNDLYRRLVCGAWLKREPGDRELVLAARLSNVVVIGLALAVIPFLSSIQEAWRITLLFGAGVGGVLVLRWVWERVGAWSELSAMAAALVLGPVVLVLSRDDVGVIDGGWDGEWVRLGVVAAGSTGAAVIAAIAAGPPEDAVLRSFYGRVRPPGWWGRAARLCGDDPARGPRALGRALVTTGVTALSLFATLVGAARVLVPDPDGGRWAAVVALVVGLGLVPVWWGRVKASSEQREAKI